MVDCMDVCEVVIDTLINLGYGIKTERQDCTDVLDAFCEYNQDYADLLSVCKYALDAVEDSELYPQDATNKLVAVITKIEKRRI